VRAALVLACLPFLMGTILRWPLFGICFFMMTDFVRPQDLTWGFEEVRFALVISLTTLVAYLAQSRRFRSVPAPRSEPLLIGLGVVMLLSAATAAVSVETALDWWSRYVKIVVFCVLIARVVDTRRRLTTVVAAIVFGVGILASWAFLQHFQGNERLEGIGNGGDQNNSNHLGAIFALTLPLNVALAVSSRKGSWTRLGAMALVPVILADVIFTQSRAAYLATVALTGAAILKKRIRRKVLGWALVCGVLGGIVGVGKYASRAETIVSDGSRGAQAEDGSIALRIQLWQHAVEFFSRNPLTGMGPQNAGLLIKNETAIAKAKSIHNTYLQLLADGGILCCGFWCFALLAGWQDSRAAVRVATAKGDAELARYGLALELGISGFVAASMFHSFEYLEIPYWVFTLAGVVRGLAVRSTGSPEESRAATL
jgi:probable O-glycosylation ligase (exosortase A-associated)